VVALVGRGHQRGAEGGDPAFDQTKGHRGHALLDGLRVVGEVHSIATFIKEIIDLILYFKMI